MLLLGPQAPSTALSPLSDHHVFLHLLLSELFMGRDPVLSEIITIAIPMSLSGAQFFPFVT